MSDISRKIWGTTLALSTIGVASLARARTARADVHIDELTSDEDVKQSGKKGGRRDGERRPTAPRDLRVAEVTTNSVGLRWSAPEQSRAYVAYDVWRSREGLNFSVIATFGPETFRYANLGLTPSTLYYYTVSARLANGAYSAARPVSATTLRSRGYPTWNPYLFYRKGHRVNWRGHNYQAVADIQGDGDESWINAPALWRPLG